MMKKIFSILATVLVLASCVKDLNTLPQGFLADPANVDTLAIYSYRYWGLFDTAFSRIGWDFVDGTISIDDALAQIDAEISDAIAAQ